MGGLADLGEHAELELKLAEDGDGLGTLGSASACTADKR